MREIVAIFWMLVALQHRLPRRVVVFTDSRVGSMLSDIAWEQSLLHPEVRAHDFHVMLIPERVFVSLLGSKGVPDNLWS